LDGLDVEWRQADVREPAAIRAALTGADVVYHLAAVISITGDPTGRVWSTNVGGLANVAEAAMDCGVRRLVHCSSVHAFDIELCGASLDETGPRALRPQLPAYDRSKAAGEAELRARVAKGLDAVVVNPTGMIGPYDFEPSRMGRFFLALRAHELRGLVDGAFDWVDVRDVAAALVGAACSGRTGESYLVGGHQLSMPELAGLAARLTGVRAPRVVVPMSVARVAAWALSLSGSGPGSSPLFTSESLHALRNCPRITSRKAELELGYRQRPIEVTVSDLYHWFEQAAYT
jgi:dihydroflavonol-4-reductase